MKIFITAGYTIIYHKMNGEISEEESRTSLGETKKIQIELSTPCNKKEQQQDAKNNAEV